MQPGGRLPSGLLCYGRRWILLAFEHQTPDPALTLWYCDGLTLTLYPDRVIVASSGADVVMKMHLPSVPALQAERSGSRCAACSRAPLRRARRAISPCPDRAVARTTSSFRLRKLPLSAWKRPGPRRPCAIDHVESGVHNHRSCHRD